MSTTETPDLEYGVPSPEAYLPESFDWFWYAVGAGVAVLLVILYFCWKKFWSKPKMKTHERDFYTPAKASLKGLREKVDQLPLAHIAAHASLALRAYLAGSRSEPALYQTVEEFKATHGRMGELSPTTERLLNDLNAAKYDRSRIDSEKATDFLARSRACLDSLHQSRTEDEDSNEEPEETEEP